MGRSNTLTRQQFTMADNIIAEAIRNARQRAGLVHYQPRPDISDDASADR